MIWNAFQNPNGKEEEITNVHSLCPLASLFVLNFLTDFIKFCVWLLIQIIIRFGGETFLKHEYHADKHDNIKKSLLDLISKTSLSELKHTILNQFTNENHNYLYFSVANVSYSPFIFKLFVIKMQCELIQIIFRFVNSSQVFISFLLVPNLIISLYVKFWIVCLNFMLIILIVILYQSRSNI